jgi:hypothetical protein
MKYIKMYKNREINNNWVNIERIGIETLISNYNINKLISLSIIIC